MIIFSPINLPDFVMKPNPLYFFLNNQSKLSTVKKADYLMVLLKTPNMDARIQFEGQTVTLISHHLSVYNEYDEGVGFSSLYHYTAEFDAYVVHVYFDKDGERSEPFIKEKTSAYKALPEYLPAAEKSIINQLIDTHLHPVIYRINASHTQLISETSRDYFNGLKEIYDLLFDESTDTTTNLAKISHLIESGESLKQLSYHFKGTASLDHLKKQFFGINLFKEQATISSDIGPSVKNNIPVEINDTILQEIITDIPAPPIQNVTNLCEDFEKNYNHVTDLFTEYDKLLFNQLDAKNAILKEVHSLIADLFANSQVLLKLDPSLINKPDILIKAGIGLDYLFSTYEERGTLLLTLCLMSSAERINQFGIDLSNCAKFIKLDCIDASIRKGNLAALTYLINHNVVAIKHHHVAMDKNQSRLLPLICAAFELKQYDCFLLLLKHNADIFALYENNLPLAHTLINLPVHNPYRLAVIENTPYFPNKSGQFYSLLASSIRIKLSEKMLSNEEKMSLQESLSFYEEFKKDGNGHCVSKKSQKTSVELLKKMNPDVCNDLFKSPHYRNKLLELQQLSKKFSNILKNQHQENKFKTQSSLFLNEVNQAIDKNHVFKENLYNMDEETILAGMDTYIQQLGDYMYIWTNQNKHLGKKEQRFFNETLKRVEAMSQDMSEKKSNSLDNLRKTINNIYSLVDDIANSYQSPKITRSNLEDTSNISCSADGIQLKERISIEEPNSVNTTHNYCDMDGNDPDENLDFLKTAEEDHIKAYNP